MGADTWVILAARAAGGRRRERVLHGDEVADLLSVSLDIERPDVDVADFRQPGQLLRLQPAGEGVSTSNTGLSSSRIERTSSPAHQKKVCMRAPCRRARTANHEIACADEKASSDIPSRCRPDG